MPSEKKIVVSKNGPYLVTGDVPLALQTIGVDAEGTSTKWIEGRALAEKGEYHLCRCGHSGKKPFCDGTHAKIKFQGDETADRRPVLERAEVMDGPALQLADDESLCAFARFCDANGKIWNQVQDTDDAKTRRNFVRQAGDCPSGRLLAVDKASGKVLEPKLPQSIGVIEDPAEGCSGPLWARGGVTLASADGRAYETRNRMTLCRCGRSENKPFCNGAHASEPKFQDGIKA